jgi:ornithine cyclodeaminase
MKIISQKQIRALNISPATCVDWIRESFALKQRAELPAKISVHPEEGEFFTSMPCLLPSPNEVEVTFKRRYFGVKEVHRLLHSVPSLGSDMLLYDAQTGELLALLDTDWITTMRTGAVAALAAKTLRKSTAKTYGMVGLGNTARAALLCILEQEPERHFPVKLVRYKDQAVQFMDRFKEYQNVSFEVVESAEEMASKVDVFISCITNAQGLLVPDEQRFKAGVTVIPVHMRGLQNCDTVFDRVFGDDTGHVCGFKWFSQWRDYNELGEVLAGRDPGRRSDEQRIIDYNYGIALHDVVFAAKIYERLKDSSQEITIAHETAKFWV